MLEQTASFFGRNPKRALGPIQVWVLRVISVDHANAFGTGIAAKISELTGREMADAQIYMALRRLESRGLIVSKTGDHSSEPSSRTRGRPRKFYELTATGKRALEAADAFNFGTADQRIDKDRDNGRNTGWKGDPALVG